LAKLVYLIPREKIENRGVEGSFLDALLLSLYGDAFSPREEFLMLQLFKNAIANEVRNIKTGPLEIIQAESVVPKMILSYNKRKQGVEYLKTTFGSLLKDVVTQDYVFEFNPARISQQLSMSPDPSKKVEGAELDRKVKETIEKRTQQLISVCQQALERIVGSLTSLPYGLRLICKQLTQLCGEAFPRSPKEEIHKVIGYFVYYRFINLCITQPESFEIVTGDLTMNVRKNLISVAKVLQKLFDFSAFNQEDEKVANPWIIANRAQVVEYINDLTSISDAEDYLAVNKYMELTQKTKPLILISDHEIAETHELLVAYQSQVAPDGNDPLRVVLKDLGEAPKPASNDPRDVQLTLENRFKDSIQEEMSADAHLYEETKELIIQIFKSIPIRASTPQTLMSILKEATKFAKDQNNKTLGKNITKVLKNMEKLEEKGKITKKDRYTSLLRDVALEVSNRASKREQQRKEIERLQATLKNLKKHQDYMSNQINEFEKYLAGCRVNAAKKAKEKRKKPIKFAFKELVKKEVVLESDVPESSQGKTKLFISMPEIGKFEIEAKIAGMSVTKMHLDLEDLLERKDNNIPSLDLDQVVLSVPNTILLFNKEFLS
jgi:Ras GTPase-activating-like protein IQGAP2/3